MSDALLASSTLPPQLFARTQLAKVTISKTFQPPSPLRSPGLPLSRERQAAASPQEAKVWFGCC